jgi:hypothetical protein
MGPGVGASGVVVVASHASAGCSSILTGGGAIVCYRLLVCDHDNI